jgi:hypothetical protein
MRKETKDNIAFAMIIVGTLALIVLVLHEVGLF